MNRLTQKDEQGNWCLKGLPWKQLHVGNPITRETYELIYAALWKLKEYEDTGLTPEEILDGKMLTGWIPVAERVPETSGVMREDEKLLILLPDGMRTVSFFINTSSGGKIFFDGWDSYNPVAWMPLPKPYRTATLRKVGVDAGQYADNPTLQSAT